MPGSLDSVMIKQKKNGVDNIAHTHTQNEFATEFLSPHFYATTFQPIEVAYTKSKPKQKKWREKITVTKIIHFL